MQTLRHRIVYAMIAFLVAFVPTLTTLVLHQAVASTPLEDYKPRYNNDAVGYWLYIRAFRDVGFDNGYFVRHEVPARIGGYDVHGFVYPMVYGTLTRLFAWSSASIIYTHMILVTLGVLTFIALTRPTRRQLFLLAICLASFYPLLLYMTTAMQEPLHIAFTLVLAGFLVRGVRRPLRLWEVMACVLLLAFASLLRFWWAIMLLPVLALMLQNVRSFWLKWGIAFVGTGVFALLSLRAYGLIASPGKNSIVTVLEAFQASISSGLGVLWQFIASNLTELAKYPLGLDALMTFSLIALLLGIAYHFIRKRTLPTTDVLIFYVVGVSLVLSILLYLYAGYHRLFAAPLLMSALLWLMTNRLRWVYAVIALQVLALPSFMGAYTFQAELEFNPYEPPTFAPDLIRYMPNAPAWCNTLSMDVRLYDDRLLVLPSGIGVTWWEDQPFDTYSIPKSKYLWFETYYFGTWEASLTVHNPFTVLQEIGKTVLVENTYADCDSDVLAGVWAGDTPAYIPVEYFDAPFAQRRDSFAQVTQMRTGAAVTQAGQVIIPDAPFWVRPADGIYRQFVLANPSDKTLTLLPSITEAQAQTLAQALQDGEAYITPNGERAGVFTSMESLAFSPTPKADRAIATFDGVLELLSIEVLDELEAGEWLPIRLRWRVNATTHQTYYTFTQVWDMQTVNRGIPEGMYDETIGREHLFYYLYPTQNWQAGEIVEQTRLVRVAEDAPAGGYRVAATVAYYDGTGIIPRIAGNDGNDQWAVGAKTRITPNLAPIPDDATALDAQFGDSIALTAAHIAQDGSTRTFSLAWQASAQPSTDYTLFIHALDKDGQLLAQTDAPLLAGLYPTSYWGAGQTITSQHTLTLPDDAKIASYNIGLYHPATLERLPATQDGQASPDNVIQLGE